MRLADDTFHSTSECEWVNISVIKVVMLPLGHRVNERENICNAIKNYQQYEI